MTFPAQTFTTGQVLTAAQMNEVSTEINDLWRYTYRSVTGTSDTLLLADSYNKAITYSNTGTTTITIPNSSSVAFTSGAVVNLLKTGATGTISIVQGSGVTIQSAGLTSTNPTITSVGGFARIIKTGGDSFTVEGDIVKTAAAAGGGKILQVVTATTNTNTLVSSSVYTDTTLTASITPSSTSSRILVLVSQSCWAARTAMPIGLGLQLLRGATVIWGGVTNYNMLYSNSWNTAGLSDGFQFNGAVTYLDSPSTTSSTTYKTQGLPYLATSSGQARFQWDNNVSTITLLEVGP